MNKFEEAIKAYLDQRASSDPLFAQSYAKENKSIEECCRYIIGEASKQRDGNCAIISDDVVFGMAVHYYDEDDINIEEVNCGVSVSNRPTPSYVPTDEEQQAARERALQRLENEKYQQIRKENREKVEKAKGNQTTLFDLL